jgi:hypothetical protein
LNGVNWHRLFCIVKIDICCRPSHNPALVPNTRPSRTAVSAVMLARLWMMLLTCLRDSPAAAASSVTESPRGSR